MEEPEELVYEEFDEENDEEDEEDGKWRNLNQLNREQVSERMRAGVANIPQGLRRGIYHYVVHSIRYDF